MMKQKMSKSSTTFSIFLLICFTITLSSAHKSSWKAEIENQKIAARDAITLTIREIRETKKFISSIPKLKSVRLTLQDPNVLQLCTEGLIVDLNGVQSSLNRVKSLDELFLRMDTDTLKSMAGQSVKMEQKCSKALKTVDGIAVNMLTRKLDDLSVMIDYVVYHVSEIEKLEREGHEAVEKP